MLDLYYDVVCPYAYMAFAQLPALRRRLGVEIRLRPVLLGGLLRHMGGPADPNQAMAPARARMNRLDIERWADLHGMPLRIPPGHPRRTVEAMRLVIAAGDERREAVSADLFAAYWVEGADVSQREVVDAIARRHAIDEAAIDGDDVRQALFDATAAAATAGVFGVPTFVGASELVWGQDRIGLLRRFMGERELDLSAWLDLEPITSAPGTTVAFFHDVSSPFSYLASTQIERVVARHGAALQWIPILLGALFREIGTPDVPLHTFHPTRQAWARRDAEHWAEAWGVPFRFPSRFPIRSVLPQRVALVEPSLAADLYRAAWVEDRRIDEPSVVAEIVSAAGMDASAVLDAASSPAIKDALRANTAEAVQSGVCGVPTFDVRRPGQQRLMLWGQDRLVMLDAALRGWTPAAR